MCCFSGSPQLVKHVSATNIFARAVADRQLLAYSMNIAAEAPVAMILPLPVPPRAAEDAVQFINLEAYPRLFVDLSRPFRPSRYRGPMAPLAPAAGGPSPLQVHRVGRFEASFVPSLSDFTRLDARFRIDDEVWHMLPQYQDWGFAVFKLVDLRRGWFGTRRRTIHPMALSFPRRDDNGLFFPTVHIHDGTVHAEAHFDHQLYFQSATPLKGAHARWLQQRTHNPAAEFVDVARAQPLVDGSLSLECISVHGTFANADIWLRASP